MPLCGGGHAVFVEGALATAAPAHRVVGLVFRLLPMHDLAQSRERLGPAVVRHGNDVIGARVDFGAEPKQQLLELRSEAERLNVVCELLERAATTLETERDVRARAAQNGKVVPGDD